LLLKAWIYRLHRWSALVFALPLLIVFVTGLVLAFEPAVVTLSVAPNSVDAAKLGAILAKHDPDGKLERIVLHAHSNVLVLGNRDGVEIDLATGEPAVSPSATPAFFSLVRKLHETFLIDNGQLAVVISTFALLVLILLGLFLGARPFRNTLSGWHTGTAWIALPLIIAAPATGLMMYYKVTFSAMEPNRSAATPPSSMADALGIVARERDISTLLQLRLRKGVAEARLLEGGEQRFYTVTRDGLAVRPRNWPKLLHEGNWAGVWSAAANAGIAAALVTLLGTGLFMWGRRKVRRRRSPAERASAF
jgi:uncharacterized iron-regulated membrane protein